MGYKISITETRCTTKEQHGEWTIVATVEVPRDPSFIRGEKDSPTRIKEVYGYPPERPVKVIEETRIFTQEVEDLDLLAVIKVINGL